MSTPPHLVRSLLTIALLGFSYWPGISTAVERSDSYLAALESISTDQLRDHVLYLADDDLKGRKAGRPGGHAAGQYVADLFGQLELRGTGDNDGFFQTFGNNYRNVLGLLDGSDEKLRNQVIVIGAHYDHVGYGTRRDSRGPIGRIHNGADDNASGTAALLEVAEAFSLLPEPPKRSVLFIGFDAEEKGLLGSQHWCAHPNMPLKRPAAMIDMDMVGRLRDSRLHVFGSRTGEGLRRLLSRQNDDLKLSFCWELKRKADHYPFFKRNMPVLLFNTGLHDVYHTPRDDAPLVNNAGMRRVSRLVFQVAHELAQCSELPHFRTEAGRENESMRKRLAVRPARLQTRLGVTWDTGAPPGPGLRLATVSADSAAEKGGLLPGDRIVKFAGREIVTGDDLRGAVLAAKNPAEAVVKRPNHDEPLNLKIELAGRPLRLGIMWRVDPAT